MVEEFAPEEKAEIIIWDWLKTKSLNVKEIYFNRENKLGWKKFRVEGLQSKPDFIVKIEDGFKEYYVAIEVKSTDSSKNVLNASKIIDLYLRNYETTKTQYFIEDKKIDLAHFLIATDTSPKGFLFWNETLIDNLANRETANKSKIYATENKMIPRFEGHRTFEFVRFLWSSYKDRNQSIGIGILIADVETDFEPKMMITSYNSIKKRWGQRWWKI